MAIELHPGNTETLILPNLRDQNGDPVEGATITATLYKKPGLTEVADPAIDGLVLTDIPGAPGDYSAVIVDTFNAPHGRNYSLVYEGESGGEHFRFQQPAEVLPLATE